MRNQKEKIELQKKVHKRICMWKITFLVVRPPSYVIFCRFFRVLRFYEEKKFCFRKWWRRLAPPVPPSPNVYGRVNTSDKIFRIINIMLAKIETFWSNFTKKCSAPTATYISIQR